MSNNILYCVLHTELQKQRVQWIKNTWGQNKNIIFYSDYNDLSNSVFKVSNRNDYASGQEKQINVFTFLNYILDSYDWYVFCDNDTFINTKLLENECLNFDKDKIYGEIINCWPNDPNLHYPSGGAGFVIHNSIIKTIFLHLKQNYDIEYSDVSLGINIKNSNISLKNHKLFHSQNSETCKIKDTDVKNHISFHYITNYELMEKLYKLCQ